MTKQLKLSIHGFSADLSAVQDEVAAAHRLLHSGQGPGSDSLGWLNLPGEYDHDELQQIIEIAAEIRQSSSALVVIGAGGSYAGSRSAIEMLCHPFGAQLDSNTVVYFAGHNLSSRHHQALLEILRDKDFSINVVSKSGGTIEPALAFRLFRDALEEKYGKDAARRRIFVTSDEKDGALRNLANQEDYRSFVIPRDIGGRYSVLTPVGLLPMAVAGIDIARVMKGAEQARQSFLEEDLERNPCYRYAAVRNLLYSQGKAVELLVCYEPDLQMLGEWWKQLFAESEGKEGKGLFPASAAFTTDLHSLGQFIQQGSPCLFETVLRVKGSGKEVVIPAGDDRDGLSYLAGKDLEYVNEKAFQGTLQAHVQGGVPNIVLDMEDFSEESFGYLVYFFMKACAISGYMLGVNPFDQPGVEAYKENMKMLLEADE